MLGRYTTGPAEVTIGEYTSLPPWSQIAGGSRRRRTRSTPSQP